MKAPQQDPQIFNKTHYKALGACNGEKGRIEVMPSSNSEE
jgi:hypothetical protein